MGNCLLRKQGARGYEVLCSAVQKLVCTFSTLTTQHSQAAYLLGQRRKQPSCSIRSGQE